MAGNGPESFDEYDEYEENKKKSVSLSFTLLLSALFALGTYAIIVGFVEKVSYQQYLGAFLVALSILGTALFLKFFK